MSALKRRRAVSPTKRAALNTRLVDIQSQIARLAASERRVDRDEFVQMTRSLRQVEQNAAALATQFTRIAHLQADVDAIKRPLVKAGLLD